MSQLKYFNPVTQEWEPTIVGANGEKGEAGIVAQSGEPSTDVLWLDTDEDGVGIPLGGSSGQVLAKVDSDDFNTEWVTPYTQSDAESDISTAIANVVDTAPEVLDTLNELSSALNNDPNFASTVADALAALVPAGTVIQSARVSAPAGYLLCEGQAVSRSTYSALFDAIGTTYGVGDGSSTFNIPNLQGKVPVGKDAGTFSTLGATGGAETHTLTADQMPSHSHELRSDSHTGGAIEDRAVAFNRGYPANGLGTPAWVVNVDAERLIPFGQGYVSNTGDGNSHNNLQPYIVLNYMIKI
jgi:microcystin-dependent protein